MLVAVPLALVAAASALALVRWPIRWAQALVWILVLQNAVVIAAWKASGSTTLATDLLYAKEVIIAGGGAVAVVLALRGALRRELTAVMWLALAFGVLCAIWVPVSYLRHEHLEQIARGLRSLIYPVLLLGVGCLVLRTQEAALALRRTLLWAGALLGVSAVVERTFIPVQFWVSINLQQYWVNARGESAVMLNGGLPWNFFLLFGHSVIRRAFGIMTDPLDLSYFLILPLALGVAEICRALTQRQPVSRLAMVASVTSAVGITFSLSRVPIAIGGGLAVVTPLVALGLARGMWRRAGVAAVAAAAAFVVILVLGVATSPTIGPGSLAALHPIGTPTAGVHISSLLRATNWRPLTTGQGLGTAGYLSAKFAPSAQIAYENYYLDIAHQVGILGALLMIGLLVLATLQLLLARGSATLLSLSLPTGAVLGLLAVAAMLSGQLEVITSLGATMLFVGLMVSVTAKNVLQPGNVRNRLSELATSAVRQTKPTTGEVGGLADHD
ncbi:MAG: hypothetical protein J2P45_16920 [Candidatus Dormibacteraeota bacterium]|nr:hypothetical protein [Candidatus Dormibacteraeota bacterium]